VLTRVTAGMMLAVLAAVLALVAGQSAALAGGGPGGAPFGSVVCGQSYAPACSVSAGSSGSPGTAGTQQGGAVGTSATLVSGGTGSPTGCNGTVNKTFGCIPAGCTLTAQTVGCPIGVPGAAPPPAGGAPVLPAPAVLAQLAVKYLQLPDPVIRSSPAPGALQLTRLPLWLWVAANVWQPQSKTAQVPGEAVTATATPVSAAWAMGDGKTVTCKGPGTPYAAGDNPSAASPTCGYTYEASSAGQPGGAYKVTVTITWDITWAGAGGAGGALAPLQTVAAAEFRVAESQALNTSGG
jgi:hypothetical protein